ncbi:phosphotransferase family protein [Tomitella fengzijianii]|uniref:Phosphotransferase family protein n=1 Tax=Tomitella fengzijianii TaxID=2597660 RepID=A0A516X8L1_9ACTN|nr:phosphotransferase family protein [Tomitella fengzijianii]
MNTVVTTTRTDLAELAAAVQAWLSDAEDDPSLTVEDLERSESSGMSSVTVLFTAVGDGARSEQVLRLAPEPSALPVFESYDLHRQAAVTGALADAGHVPVPRVRRVEESPAPLGRPFLVMDRAEGAAPADNPPYVFGGPLVDATPAQRDRVQRASVALLTGVHATPPPDALRADGPAGSGLARLVDDTADYYEWTVADGGVRVPILEDGLRRLRDERPAQASSDVLTWGDARIGNILYRDFAPTAALDWEGAALAPPEFDVAWFVFFHRMYQDMAESFGKPGLPAFLRAADVLAQYRADSGRTLHDMPYFLMLAAVRMGIIFARIKARSVHFGDTPAPADPDEYVLHHRMLRAILDDRYEWEI